LRLSPQIRDRLLSQRRGWVLKSPVPSAGAGLFSEDLLQDVLVQCEISYHTLQPGILFLKLAQSPDLAGTQITVLLLPDVELASDMPSRSARLSLACQPLLVATHMQPAPRGIRISSSLQTPSIRNKEPDATLL
jgi:hypothetical protein